MESKKIICLMLSLILFLFPHISFADTKIQGKPSATQEQCVQWMKDKDVEQEFIDLVPFIYEECEKANIDPVLVIAQSSLETAYYTSYTFREYHNSAGIKSRSNTNKYQYYDSYEEGFKAQICHLALYCGNPQEDYYYSERLDGWVTTIEGLSGTWAEDRHYGEKILSLIEQIKSYEIEHKEEYKEEEKIKVNNKKENTKTPVSIIENILNNNKKHSNGFYKIFEYLK
jgi:flagellum-specific peptidoglycan hydrolase FlgJ